MTFKIKDFDFNKKLYPIFTTISTVPTGLLFIF